MGYPYEDLDDTQFERLIVECSRKLFGIGVQSFSAGPDGGRDARFDGTAEYFPSTASPWTGVTVIQAKHTNATNAHFSDKNFSGDATTSVLTNEINRIKKLVNAQEVRNYILFTNRRLGASAATGIMDRIVKETGLNRSLIFLAGSEYLDNLLHLHANLITLANIDPIDGPLLVSSYDLAEVILVIDKAMSGSLPVIDASVVDRVTYAQKNKLNNMSKEFADTLSKNYMLLTRQIAAFLADPGNSEHLKRYESAVEEFQLKIVASRSDFQSFDDLFNYLVDFLAKRDGVLSRRIRLLRAMLFYMYWHCDIGKSADVESK